MQQSVQFFNKYLLAKHFIMKPSTITRVTETKNLKYLKKILDFTSNLQKGDLGLAQLIQYGFVLYGQTKTGKTASGHILSGNPLRGQKKDGEQVVEATTSRNRKAKIGNQGNSETLIPNFFEVKLKNGRYSGIKTFVIDTPGYGDSSGVLTILSNGYYHFRLYSKVKNMKFILCVERAHISNTAQKLIDTISQFTSSFKNYLDVKEQIWKSCAILVTKVEQSEDPLKDLEDKFQNIISKLNTQLMPEEQQALKGFIKCMIKEKKIFFIKKIKKGQSSEVKGLLQSIDEGVKAWWSRELDSQNKNIVNMQPVQFSLAKKVVLETTSKERSKMQFIELIDYYNIRIKQFVETKLNDEETKKKGSLGYVMNQLVEDSMGKVQSHQFIELMSNYVKNYYQKYDQTYRQERQMREKQMFALSIETQTINQMNSLKSKQINEKSYIVKKFQVLAQVEKLKSEISMKQKVQSSKSEGELRLQWLKDCEASVYSIIKQFNKISFKRNNSAQIIYKYGYIIHRIIQQSKIFILLMDIYASPEIRKNITDIVSMKFIELVTPLKSFMGVDYFYNNSSAYTYEKLHSQYVKNFNMDKVSKKIVINESLIEFFSKINSEDQSVVKKIIRLILKYSDQVLQQFDQKIQVSLAQKNRLIKRLAVSRLNCESLYFESENDSQKIQISMTIREITNNLGRILEYSNRFQTARKVYNTIRFVESACRMYKQQIKGKPTDIPLRISYAKYMADHLRQNEAIQILQQTFQIAKTVPDLTLVKQQLSDLRIKMNENPLNQYAQSLFNAEYFVLFSPELEDQLVI